VKRSLNFPTFLGAKNVGNCTLFHPCTTTFYALTNEMELVPGCSCNVISQFSLSLACLSMFPQSMERCCPFFFPFLFYFVMNKMIFPSENNNKSLNRRTNMFYTIQ